MSGHQLHENKGLCFLTQQMTMKKCPRFRTVNLVRKTSTVWEALFFYQWFAIWRVSAPCPPNIASHRTTVASKGRSQHTEVWRRWSWRCGGGALCPQRHSRRTKFQQDSPGTRRRGLRCCRVTRPSSSSCRGRCSNLQRTSDSMTLHSVQTSWQQCGPVSAFPQTPPICRPLRSTPPPSSSDQSNQSHTALVATGQNVWSCPHKGPAAPKTTCCRRSAPGTCWWCLCPRRVQPSLQETEHRGFTWRTLRPFSQASLKNFWAKTAPQPPDSIVYLISRDKASCLGWPCWHLG